MKICFSNQMRSIDEISINKYGIPGIVLMENAGTAVANVMLGLCRKSAVIVCGTGNNGGDGFVIARHLLNRDWRVKVFICGDAGKIRGDALTNLEILINMDADVSLISMEEIEAFYEEIDRCEVVVDALFGTGFKGKLSSLHVSVIDRMNNSGKTIVSVDMPSGLDGDTGFMEGICVNAHKTVTFQLAKVGQLINYGPEYCGELVVADISIPRQAVQDAGLCMNLTDMAFLTDKIRRRKNNTHKGTYGKVIVVAGSKGMLGAGLMSAKAALRSGAGLVTLGVPQSLQAAASAASCEIITKGLIEGNEGIISAGSAEQVIEMAESSNCLIFGPGLSQEGEIEEFAVRLLKKCKVPVVIDADGLNAIARKPDVLKECKSPLVVTPHPGEMARLMNCKTSDIQDNRLKYAAKFASSHGVVTVLKGFRTIIAGPEGSIYVNPTGNPGMATAGSGDVLSGIIAGFLAQGMSAFDAAVCGVYIHGAAGDAAAQKIGEYGLTASDIIEFVPHTIKDIAGK